jgi:dTDP-4-dehydrorhamnose reductase
MQDLELWGGPECTLNRVGDAYSDQFAHSGHDVREQDIALFLELGLAALRYPVLWEKLAGQEGSSGGSCGWDWHDARLAMLRTSATRPILGLVHHGSGPRHTDLLSPHFADGLAEFAGRVAARYDWVRDWTPINEPVTTARFSALYGHWYPHHRSEQSFWLALLNQIDGIRLSMRAIRRVNPDARLIQTEDLGRTFATTAMRDQAAYDNVRRWASWDLLCGRLNAGHPFWQRLEGMGFGDRLRAIADDPCPPDVVGINHYLTSDRFLDHRKRRYPAGTYGSNMHARYADLEAIRVLEPPPPGLAGLLREAWDRYGIPIAITEVHNGCTRDEQMRWLADAWDIAKVSRAQGIKVEAVTAWSLLGSAGWNTLLTRPGRYEVGAFDVSNGTPRATSIVPLLRGLKADAKRHPVVSGRGWWQRPMRLLHPAIPRPASLRDHLSASFDSDGERPLLICGATGTLGAAFARACRHRDLHHVVTARRDIDLEDPDSIARALDSARPWAVVNATGWVRVDDAQAEPHACMRINADGAAALARACADRGIQSVHFSSDLVFDGCADRPYTEGDTTAPLNAYGASKAAMEQAVAASGAHLVIRTAAFFSPHDDFNFARAVQRALASGQSFDAAADQTVSPTYVPALVDRTLDLLIDDEIGIWHLANDDQLSWADFARRIAAACGLNPDQINAVCDIATAAPRPRFSPLASSRSAGLGPLDEAIADFACIAGSSPGSLGDQRTPPAPIPTATLNANLARCA